VDVGDVVEELKGVFGAGFKGEHCELSDGVHFVDDGLGVADAGREVDDLFVDCVGPGGAVFGGEVVKPAIGGRDVEGVLLWGFLLSFGEELEELCLPFHLFLLFDLGEIVWINEAFVVRVVVG